MLPRTTFLSRLIGLYSLLMSLAMLANKAAYVAKVNSLVRDPAVLLVVAIFAVAAGLAILLTHNVWSGAPAVVVTVVGWLSLFKGLFFLWLTPEGARQYLDAIHYDQLFYVFPSVTLILGAYLTYTGFRPASR